MKYLRKFATEADATELEKPNVVLFADTNEVKFNYNPLGVYVQHIDGKLYRIEDWVSKAFEGSDANGVAVITDECSFVIAKSNISTKQWASETSVVIDGVFTSNSIDVAVTDLNGVGNTAAMLEVDTAGAAYACDNYSFPNGSKGYLPAWGEWKIAYQNKAAIDAILSVIGTKLNTASYFWSSSQYNDILAWNISWYNGDRYDLKKTNKYYVRAFAPLNI